MSDQLHIPPEAVEAAVDAAAAAMSYGEFREVEVALRAALEAMTAAGWQLIPPTVNTSRGGNVSDVHFDSAALDAAAKVMDARINPGREGNLACLQFHRKQQFLVGLRAWLDAVGAREEHSGPPELCALPGEPQKRRIVTDWQPIP